MTQPNQPMRCIDPARAGNSLSDAMKTETYFAMNRKTNKAELMTGFVCFEHLQGAFRCGIMLSDGTMADVIGRSKSVADFLNRAATGGTEVVWNDDVTPTVLEIQVNGNWVKVSYSIFRSWTGKRRIDGKNYKGPVFWLFDKERYERKAA